MLNREGVMYCHINSDFEYTLRNLYAMASNTIPDFDELSKVEGMPQGCAWGTFDKDGKKDLVGTLNLLTPDVVTAAASEVKDGVSISLK